MPRTSICVFCRRSLETRRITTARSPGVLSLRSASTAASAHGSNTADSYPAAAIQPIVPRTTPKNRKNRVQPRHDAHSVSAAERIQIALGQSSRQLFPLRNGLESRFRQSDAKAESYDDGVTEERIRDGRSRQVVRFNKTASRLGNVHNLDDLLREVHAALQTYSGLYELRHSVLALSKAITRCRRLHSASDVHSAFNMVKVALLSRGFPVMELLPIELSFIESTGSITALTNFLQASKGIQGLRITPPQMESLLEMLVDYGTSTVPTKWDGIKVAGWKRRQSTELLFGQPLTDLGTSAEQRSITKSPSKLRSLRSFISDKNVGLLCSYIRTLGKLNANHEIWSEWRTSRYLVVPWKPDAKPQAEDQSGSQQLLLAFVEAFISCRDLRSVWVLLERVKQRNPSAITPEVWASILGYQDSKTAVAVDPRVGALSGPTRWPGLLTAVTTRLVQDGQGGVLGDLAKSGTLAATRRSEAGSGGSGQRVWRAWADGMSVVINRSTEDCLPAVEQTLSNYRA